MTEYMIFCHVDNDLLGRTQVVKISNRLSNSLTISTDSPQECVPGGKMTKFADDTTLVGPTSCKG